MLEFDIKATAGAFRLAAAGHQDSARMGLCGPSGAGKTTLLYCLAGLIRPAEGFISLDGRKLFDAAQGLHVPPHRREIGFVFQEGRLFPHMDVRRNVEYGRRSDRSAPPIGELADVLELNGLLDRFPDTLSGGERQRTALARTLASAPRLLLLDEPMASIDRAARLRIMGYLRRAHERWRFPFLFVSHSMSDVLFLTEKCWTMSDGTMGGPVRPQDLPAGPQEAILNIIPAEVRTVPAHAGYAEVACLGREIRVPGEGLHVGDEVTLALPAEDILLSLSPPHGLSARNILPAHVARLTPAGTYLWVWADVGGTEVGVKLTEDAGRELGLRPGLPVHLVFKTHSVAVADLTLGKAAS